MTIKEVAETLGKDESTIRKIGKELFPDIFRNGIRTELSEIHATAIKLNLGKNSELPKTALEKQLIIRQAMILQDEIIEDLQKQLAGANEKIALDAPKVEFHDAVTQSADSLDFAQVAKLLNIPGMGRNKMLLALRDRGILRYDNSPYQQYVDRGYFKQVETSFTRGEVVGVNLKTVVFQKGIDFIRKELAK